MALRIILLGPPGAGKGTVSRLVCAHYNLPYVSTGDIFRAAVDSKSALCRKVAPILSAGHLVPDELTNELVRKRLSTEDCTHNGFLLDGYPRTLAQAQALEKMLAPRKVDYVFSISLSQEEVVRRLSARRVCPKCGRIYNLLGMKPRREGVCDGDGSALAVRDDDRLDTIKKRLEVYEKQTRPLEEKYRGEGLLVDIHEPNDSKSAYEGIYKAVGGKG